MLKASEAGWRAPRGLSCSLFLRLLGNFHNKLFKILVCQLCSKSKQRLLWQTFWKPRCYILCLVVGLLSLKILRCSGQIGTAPALPYVALVATVFLLQVDRPPLSFMFWISQIQSILRSLETKSTGAGVWGSCLGNSASSVTVWPCETTWTLSLEFFCVKEDLYFLIRWLVFK